MAEPIKKYELELSDDDLDMLLDALEILDPDSDEAQTRRRKLIRLLHSVGRS